MSVVFAVFFLSVGCVSDFRRSDYMDNDVIRVIYLWSHIRLDGLIDEPVWSAAPCYELRAIVAGADSQPREIGWMRACWDEEFLYVAIKFEDSDIIAESADDQAHHYRYGDVAELFIKPRDADCYWEFHATPRGNQTAFFYPSRGHLGLPSNLDHRIELKVAANASGSINDWTDRDNSWSAEFAVPLKDLEERSGVGWGNGSNWKLLMGRYNYGRYGPNCELTAIPSLTVTDFHRHEQYADLVLELPSAAPGDTGR